MRHSSRPKSQSASTRRNGDQSRPLTLEPLEPRVVMSANFATIDGTFHNLDNPEWGSTDEQLLRLTTVEYEDGVSAPAGQDRPSAREVSNAVAAQDQSVLNDRHLTDFVWLWGQFIDHDIDLTENGEPADPMLIDVPTGDNYFDPYSEGEKYIDFNRSVYDPATGDAVDNPRQQINQITAFIDGSVIYGSDVERATALRTFSGGRLKTSEGDLLPYNEEGLPNAGGPSNQLFLAGDVRANENVALSAMHTLFVREHNRIADEIAAKNPKLSDEQIYLRARAMVTAEMQAITYNEFLPALLGEGALSEYQGYDPTVNPGISNLFSTASYRFGHSMLSPELMRVDDSGATIAAGNLSLQDAFFAPQELVMHGIDSILAGFARQQAQEIDTMVVDDVRNFLFGPPGAGGFDLVSLNIQRGRDHGLADYNQVREDLGLGRVTSFAEITSNVELQQQLEEVYGDVDNIDAWVGGLAEDHVAGASVGALIHTVLVDQFERLRDGDRLWYQNVYSGKKLAQIESTTLADVIRRNTGISHIRDDVFRLDTNYDPVAEIAASRISGQRGAFELDASGSYDLEQSTESLKFLWDLDNDGRFDDATGMTVQMSTDDFGRGRSAKVNLMVVDSEGNVDIDTAVLKVAGQRGRLAKHAPGQPAKIDHGPREWAQHRHGGHRAGRGSGDEVAAVSNHDAEREHVFAQFADGIWGDDLVSGLRHRRSR